VTSQEPIAQAERELAEVKGLVDEQYGIVIRLKRLGADTHEAVRLLIDLLELQQNPRAALSRSAKFTIAGNVLGTSHHNFLYEQFRRRSTSGLFLEINIGKPLPAAVTNFKSHTDVLDRPGRREAAG